MAQRGSIQSAAAPRVAQTEVTVGSVQAYFQSQRAGLDAQLTARLVDFLNAATTSLDCAIYDLRHPLILDALARAATRGVYLRIAYDASAEHTGGLSADPKPGGTREALAAAGLEKYSVPIHERGRHLMHDKFVLRDGRSLWVGSANFTRGGLELQDNICLAVNSPELVARFEAAFATLVGPEHRHTEARTLAASDPGVVVGPVATLPLFSPEAGKAIARDIVAAIQGAHSIRLLAFLLSDPDILAALAPLAHDPTFDIRGVYDPNGMQDVLRYSHQDRALFWFMNDPRFVAAPSHAFSAWHEQDFMHNKTFIIDDKLVFTGSYNFSENAEANDEVVLRLDSAPLAVAFSAYANALHAAYRGGAGGVHPKSPAKDAEATSTASRRHAAQGDAKPAATTQPRTARDILIRIVAVLVVLVAIALVATVILALSGVDIVSLIMGML